MTPEQAETIFYFQLNGCLAVNKNLYRNGSKDWEASRDLIGGFIQNGLKRYICTLARNSPLSLVFAVATFPEQPLISLALVIGNLIELPVLSVISGILKRWNRE